MTTETNSQGGSSQTANSQSSSGSNSGQSNSGAQGAQGQGSEQQHQQVQQGQQGQQANSAPQRHATILESEWDATANTVKPEYFERAGKALAFQAEHEVRKNSLPTAPDKYEVRLPADFKPPEGVTFEFDKNDPALARARELAHKRGVDQETFSDMLGVFAATKIDEQQRTAQLIQANRERLGSAADARIGAIDTWLSARVGDKAKPMIAALKAYPVVETVEAFEAIIRQFSNQGGADFTQSGRSEQQPAGKIAGYENMSFIQRRAAQDALAGKTITPARASGGR